MLLTNSSCPHAAAVCCHLTKMCLSVITYQPHFVCASLLKQTNVSVAIPESFIFYGVQQIKPKASAAATGTQQDAGGTGSNSNVSSCLAMSCWCGLPQQRVGWHMVWRCNLLLHKHPDLESDVMNGVASCFPVFSMFFPFISSSHTQWRYRCSLLTFAWLASYRLSGNASLFQSAV